MALFDEDLIKFTSSQQTEIFQLDQILKNVLFLKEESEELFCEYGSDALNEILKLEEVVDGELLHNLVYLIAEDVALAVSLLVHHSHVFSDEQDLVSSLQSYQLSWKH